MSSVIKDMNPVIKEVKTSPRIIYLFIFAVAIMALQLFILSSPGAPAEEVLGYFSSFITPISLVEGIHLIVKEWKGGSADVVRAYRRRKGEVFLEKLCGGIIWVSIGVIPLILPGVLIVGSKNASIFLMIPPYIAFGMFFGSLVRSYLFGFIGALFSSAILNFFYPFVWVSPELCVASLMGSEKWQPLFSTEVITLESRNPLLLTLSIIVFTALFLILSEVIE